MVSISLNLHCYRLAEKAGPPHPTPTLSLTSAVQECPAARPADASSVPREASRSVGLSAPLQSEPSGDMGGVGMNLSFCPTLAC
ncbi:hypothetical protein PAMP_001888 [Pampus punctatissimus]